MATIDSLTVKATPLGTDKIELNDGKSALLSTMPVSTAQAAADAVVLASAATDATTKANAAQAAAIAAAATDATTKADAAQAAAIAASLQRASNLSDLASASTAKTNLGLGNLDNTSDANKPVSTAQAAAIALKIDASEKDEPGGVAELPADDFADVVKLAGWGDSLTAGTGQTTSGGWPGALQTLNGVYVYNGGVGGETSTQIRTRMVAATTRHGYTTIIWAGRNNITQQATIEADIAAMVAALGHTRYQILSVLPSTADNGTALAQIAAINAALLATYGNRFVDMVGYLQSDAAFTAAGLTKSAQDIIDIAAGFIPSTWRSDAVHLDDEGYTAVARKIQAVWFETLQLAKFVGALLASFGELGGSVPGIVKATKLSAGAATDTTARLSILGGSGGGAVAEYRRTAGTTVTYELSLSGGGYSLKDAVAGFIVQTLMGDGNINQLYIGERGRSAATTRVSRLAATSHAASAGTDVPGVRLDIWGGLGTGAGTPGDIRLTVGQTLASGTTAQDGAVVALTIKGNSGTAQFIGRVEAGAAVKLKNYTVATLPAGTLGDTAFVTDATAPTYLGALTGGGAVACPVFYDGSAWISA